jgi:hypothetical protein
MGVIGRYIRNNHITTPMFEIPDIYVTSPKQLAWDFTKTAFSWDLPNVFE